MEGIFQWLRNLAGYFVFLSVLDQLIPEKSYGRYIRLFAGLVMMLMVISPFTDRAGITEAIVRAFQEMEFQDEAGELKKEILGAERERLTRLIRQYESVIAGDIVRMAAENGYEVLDCRVTIGGDESEENFGKVREVILQVCTEAERNDGDAGVLQLRRKISSDYNLEESNVEIQITDR
ncbi:MAG: stage III sporulation protein AF [Clostridiales bacterium]|nr:stage III sporulation protein AF [Clostridiales bacterium]